MRGKIDIKREGNKNRGGITAKRRGKRGEKRDKNKQKRKMKRGVG